MGASFGDPDIMGASGKLARSVTYRQLWSSLLDGSSANLVGLWANSNDDMPDYRVVKHPLGCFNFSSDSRPTGCRQLSSGAATLGLPADEDLKRPVALISRVIRNCSESIVSGSSVKIDQVLVHNPGPRFGRNVTPAGRYRVRQ
jgi:hypothetical protein